MAAILGMPLNLTLNDLLISYSNNVVDYSMVVRLFCSPTEVVRFRIYA